ncbi:MAG: response regulator receiver protein [Verrucomicrobiales bacterium]|nr:response regulator receiver protein [Verrucomicrobiales bacterium]
MPATQHTVFIIDDDASVRRSLGRVFTSAELRWHAFASAEEFLASPLPVPGDCIVADMTMPRMSGLELQQHLRASGRWEFAMILLTANDTEEMRLAAREASAAAFFRKPVDSQALLDAIAWATQTRQPAGSSSPPPSTLNP